MSFDKSTRRISPPRKGQTITARHMSEPFNILNQLNSGISPIQQARSTGKTVNISVGRFVITSIANDYLVCREFDGTAQGTSDVYISRPYLLRASMESRNGVSYTYSNSQTREATDGVDTETQEVTPDYVVDDEIYAIRGIVRGSGVSSEPAGNRKIEWLDLNIDARAWAAIQE